MKYTVHESVSLENHPDFNEKWVQEIIKNNPSVLGLSSNIEFKESEKPMTYGRLDLLLKDDVTNTRYEVELQLGKVDESHIIRVIEYWDEERNRYDQYNHVAVIIAEEITNRFLNVISLFNKHIPIIAIQLNALKIEDKILLNFTKVLNLVEKIEDFEEDEEDPVDTVYWQRKSSEKTMKAIDKAVDILKQINPNFVENCNKNYIGIKGKNNKANNAVVFWPKTNFLRVGSKNSDKEKWYKKLDDAGISTYPERKGDRVHFKITLEELEKNVELMNELFRDAYKAVNAD